MDILSVTAAKGVFINDQNETYSTFERFGKIYSLPSTLAVDILDCTDNNCNQYNATY